MYRYASFGAPVAFVLGVSVSVAAPAMAVPCQGGQKCALSLELETGLEFLSQVDRR